MLQVNLFKSILVLIFCCALFFPNTFHDFIILIKGIFPGELKQSGYYLVVVCLMIFNASWAVINYLAGVSAKDKDRRLDIHDRIFVKNALNPLCVEPTRQFVDEYLEQLSKIDFTIKLPRKKFINEFQDKKSNLLIRWLILKELNSDSYQQIAEILDNLEDVFVGSVSSFDENSDVGELESMLINSYGKILSRLIVNHGKIHLGHICR